MLYFKLLRALGVWQEDAKVLFRDNSIFSFENGFLFFGSFSSPSACFFYQSYLDILSLRLKVHVMHLF